MCSRSCAHTLPTRNIHRRHIVHNTFTCYCYVLGVGLGMHEAMHNCLLGLSRLFSARQIGCEHSLVFHYYSLCPHPHLSRLALSIEQEFATHQGRDWSHSLASPNFHYPLILLLAQLSVTAVVAIVRHPRLTDSRYANTEVPARNSSSPYHQGSLMTICGMCVSTISLVLLLQTIRHNDNLLTFAMLVVSFSSSRMYLHC
jgi:hypothetical protein